MHCMSPANAVRCLTQTSCLSAYCVTDTRLPDYTCFFLGGFLLDVTPDYNGMNIMTSDNMQGYTLCSYKGLAVAAVVAQGFGQTVVIYKKGRGGG